MEGNKSSNLLQRPWWWTSLIQGSIAELDLYLLSTLDGMPGSWLCTVGPYSGCTTSPCQDCIPPTSTSCTPWQGRRWQRTLYGADRRLLYTQRLRQKPFGQLQDWRGLPDNNHQQTGQESVDIAWTLTDAGQSKDSWITFSSMKEPTGCDGEGHHGEGSDGQSLSSTSECRWGRVLASPATHEQVFYFRFSCQFLFGSNYHGCAVLILADPCTVVHHHLLASLLCQASSSIYIGTYNDIYI